MKKIPIWLATILLSATACDDNTGTLGITNDNDQISVSYNTFELKSTTILADSIISNSNTSCFGQVTDPETGTKIKADFLAQFHVMENYKLPAYDSIVSKDHDGKVLADSIEIKFYFQKYYGDPENILKMKVYELDKQNIIIGRIVPLHAEIRRGQFPPVYSDFVLIGRIIGLGTAHHHC